MLNYRFFFKNFEVIGFERIIFVMDFYHSPSCDIFYLHEIMMTSFFTSILIPICGEREEHEKTYIPIGIGRAKTVTSGRGQ